MAGKRGTAGDLARDYCSQYPSVPSRTLARMMMREHPRVFLRLEPARSLIRRYRGQDGETSRQYGDKAFFRSAGSVLDGIPEGIRQCKPAFEVKLPCKVLVISDIHVPYHDARALDAAVNTAIKQKCDSLYINGDLLDFYQISRFCRNPEDRPGPKAEMDLAKEVMARIATEFKHLYFKEGNHEERWYTYLFNNAPEFAKFAEFKLEKVLGLEQRGWGHIAGKQESKIGKLYIAHGHELSRGIASPVNAARGVWMRSKAMMIIGDSHTISNHAEKVGLDQDYVSQWSVGCLCDLKPDYRPINNWCHGFAIVEAAKDGEFHVHNYRIIKGKVFSA